MDVTARRLLLFIGAALCFIAAIGVGNENLSLFKLGVSLGLLGLAL